MSSNPSEYLILGRVIDGTGAPPIEDGAVAVCETRIEWVGPVSELPERWSLPGVEAFDCAGKSIMPGLIDAHTHLSFGEASSEEELGIYTSVEYRSILSG